jgi:dipeptidyl aminopeptidase/acylaminoacyl peptidase
MPLPVLAAPLGSQLPRAALACALALAAVPARAGPPALIPREVLFGDSRYGNVTVSPDGARLAWFERGEDGKRALWIRPVAGGSASRVPLGDDAGVAAYMWAYDGRHLLVMGDVGGNENFHLHALDLDTGVRRNLTPHAGRRIEQVLLAPGHPGQALVTLNLRDPRVFDVHRIDLATGATTLETENPGDVVEWVPDPQFRVRAAAALDPRTGDTILRVRDRADAPWRDLQRWSFEDAGNDRYQRVLAFTPDGRGLIVQTPIGANTTRVVTLDAVAGREIAEHASDSKADVWNRFDPTSTFAHAAVLLHPRTRAVQAVAFQGALPEWKVLDRALEQDFRLIARAFRGIPDVRCRDLADRVWIVRYERDDRSGLWAVFDRTRGRVDSLFVGRPELETLPLVRLEPRTFQARDGLEIPCYLALPAGVPARKLPLVLLVHGGPWWRDEWGFDPEFQLLANRGYAVLKVNYRGSTGFGKAFLNAGDGGWGVGGMQHDLTDAVRWAVREGIADSARVAISGGSYGGYAVLAGLAFTPDLYACGVDMVGPSNVRTMIESFPPYWEARRRRWLRRIGNVIEDDALNQRISPLFHASRIRRPLLVGHGANDPRVKLAESERIVAALREKGVPVTFVVYPDEGHGFNRPENATDFAARMERFLAEHLGGRAEPSAEIAGTTAEVR